VSIHDQGAGGNANVLKEIVEPAGAKIEVRNIPAGDETLSVLELWGAEYQENDALLIKKSDAELFASICKRENTPFAFVGEVTGTGRIVLHDELDNSTPVDLDLETVLGKMPNKTFESATFAVPQCLPALSLPQATELSIYLDRVLRLLSVGSKRFLTNKVDRSVTGLVAQQQCVGPLHTPLADFGAVAQSFFGLTGGATSIGEQPLKGLISPEAMGRMTLGEAMTNLVWARITGRDHIKASGNWMWPAKLAGEGDALYRACEALRDVMVAVGPAIDGGKDSLSMAAKTDDGEVVKAPGTLVVSLYCTMKDISKKVTPDLKYPGASKLVFADLGRGKNRMGGSALAQVFKQVGNNSPDLEDPADLVKAFDAVQSLLDDDLIEAGHDRSDGGLITTALEMAFAGNCGLSLELPAQMCTSSDSAADQSVFFKSVVFPWFSEELGLVMEVKDQSVETVLHRFASAGVTACVIGATTTDNLIRVAQGGSIVLDRKMTDLRDMWEETSFALDARQANPACVAQEKASLAKRKSPAFKLTFSPELTVLSTAVTKPSIAILRQEGSNGDREMSAAFHLAGFNVWDVAMSDLESGRVSLSQFRGVAFVGGFSYADVLDSGKGWAGAIRFNPKLLAQFTEFYNRPDTFSLGICNGCQLMALMGWVPSTTSGALLDSSNQPRFIRNTSGRFESRFVSVKIVESPSIFFSGMEGSVVGVWSSHGEGRVHFPTEDVAKQVISNNLAPVRYVNDDGAVTQEYPANPNGSQEGIAALCSHNGRHLAIMPHPERTIMKWHCPWMPEDWKSDLKASPWVRMFQNARSWCDQSN
jgi:phosphoribosylformylglycinamidine synthase